MLNLNTEMEVYIKLFAGLFFIGVLFIVIGLITWKMKRLWFHRGFLPRVNQDGYAKFMGILDIFVGLIWILLSVIAFAFQKRFPLWTPFVILVFYVILMTYGETKYKIDPKKRDKWQLDRWRKK